MNGVIAVPESIPLGPLRLRASRLIGRARAQHDRPEDGTEAISSQPCQLRDLASPIKRASCQCPSPTLTSTRAIGAAPDHATPRTVSAPERTSRSGAGSVISARTCWIVTGSRTMRPARDHS